MKTAVAAPPVEPREHLRQLLWALLRKLLKHDFQRIPGELPMLKRCTRCGWGWKLGANNDFPCPGFRIDAR